MHARQGLLLHQGARVLCFAMHEHSRHAWGIGNMHESMEDMHLGKERMHGVRGIYMRPPAQMSLQECHNPFVAVAAGAAAVSASPVGTQLNLVACYEDAPPWNRHLHATVMFLHLALFQAIFVLLIVLQLLAVVLDLPRPAHETIPGQASS